MTVIFMAFCIFVLCVCILLYSHKIVNLKVTNIFFFFVQFEDMQFNVYRGTYEVIGQPSVQVEILDYIGRLIKLQCCKFYVCIVVKYYMLVKKCSNVNRQPLIKHCLSVWRLLCLDTQNKILHVLRVERSILVQLVSLKKVILPALFSSNHLLPTNIIQAEN